MIHKEKVVLPNLFIVGAPKSGTTYLYHNLKKYPDLFFPKIKELNYFSSDLLDRIEMYYKDYRVKNKPKYLAQFRRAKNEKHFVDASVSYFAFKMVPTRIKLFNQNAKIVIILRNPLNRAFSHYLMDTRMGYAPLSFKSYIHDKQLYPAHYFQYIRNSLYFENISNYMKEFKHEDICILILEEIATEWPKLLDFLEVESNSVNIDSTIRVNENKKAKNFLARYIQHYRSIMVKLKPFVPTIVINKSRKFLYEPVEKETINEADKKHLEKTFVQDVTNLGKLLNKDLNQLWNIY